MELWGCGFNQFFQIDDSGDDVHELTRIDSVPASSESNSRIEIYWAGWADLIYLCSKGGAKTLRLRGLEAPKAQKEVLSGLISSGLSDCFGGDTAVGAIQSLKHGPSVRAAIDGTVYDVPQFSSVVIAGNGYVAALGHREVKLFASLTDFLSLGNKRRVMEEKEEEGQEEHEEGEEEPKQPILELRLDANPYFNGKPRNFTIQSLSAGDAHFSFIVSWSYESSVSPSSPSSSKSFFSSESIPYYNNIWTIRTDPRSFNDSAWIPLDEELSGFEKGPSLISIKGPAKSEMPVFCAEPDTDDPIEFTKCVAAGWMTVGLCTAKRAWIFPFGRALSMLPKIPVGQAVEEAPGAVRNIALGNGHVVLLTETEEVWTFGLNDHGQRGLPSTGNGDSWRKLDIPVEAEIKQVVCGPWNTFIVLERKQGKENSEL